MVLVIVLDACNKKDILNVNSPSSTQVLTTIDVWFSKQIEVANSQVQKTNLESLKRNLQVNKLWLENYRKQEQFIIVPINNAFEVKVNKDKPVSNYFLAIVDANGNIRLGNIFQYMGTDRTIKTPLPTNTINKFYNNNHPDGQFTIIDVASMDRMEFEFDVKGGKLIRYATAKSKAEANNGSNNSSTTQSGSGCTEWYLVTTYYFEDGTSFTTEMYMYTTCKTSQFQTPGEEGGGGGDVAYITEVAEPATDIEDWMVGKSPKFTPYWEVWSTETFTGFKVATNTNHNKIASITHSTTASVLIPGSSVVPAWTETGYTSSVSPDSALAKMKISGNVIFSPGQPYSSHLISGSEWYWAAHVLF